ncbi:MAG: type IV toxin-antitoxin system AbiEi family antitoxin [Desulfobacterales bacterium]
MPFEKETGHPDFRGSIQFRDQESDIIGEVVSQKSSAIFKDKLALLKAFASREKEIVPVVIAQYLSEGKREACKKAGINYIDLSGNILLSFENLYIERVGFPNRFPEERRGRNPFSDKASLILRLLLSHKKRLWGIRELAGDLDLDPGFVSRMARELENRNYAARVNSKIRIRNAKSILEDWVREYNYKKNRESRFFCLAKRPEEIIAKLSGAEIPSDIPYALGLQAGSSLISPYAVFDSVHIYVQDQQAINYFKKQLELEEARQGENVVLMLPYYKHSAFYGRQKAKNLWVVSDLQLYLDLYNYPIRGLEQAEHLFEKRLSSLIKE